MRVDTIALWFDEKFVIVEPGSSADRLFRSKGYADEEVAQEPIAVTNVTKKRRSKKVKAGGN